jgi:hypothetical protein
MNGASLHVASHSPVYKDQLPHMTLSGQHYKVMEIEVAKPLKTPS